MMSGVVPCLACIGIAVALSYGAYTDYKSRIIPNRIPFAILVLGLLTATPIATKLISLGAIIAILVALHLLTKKKSGGGDIKVYCALAFALGLQTMAFVLTATIILSSLWTLAVKRVRLNKQMRIPLCTFLSPAYILVMIVLEILEVSLT